MTLTQKLEFDCSPELLVGLFPVDLEAKHWGTWLEEKGNLAIRHVGRQPGDVQNGFVKVRMWFGVVKDGDIWVGHRKWRGRFAAKLHHVSGVLPAG